MNDRCKLVWEKLAFIMPRFDTDSSARIEAISLQHVGNVDGRLTWDMTLQLCSADAAVALILREAWIHSMPELARGDVPVLLDLEIEDIHSWQRTPYRFRVFELPHDDNVQRGNLLECYCREIDVLPADRDP